jgi:predicted nuclease with TOPRIM domain
MTTPLHEQLDQLHAKVSQLVGSLMASRQKNTALQKRIEMLEQENRNLRRKVDKGQEQVNQMLQQWFPELNEAQEQHNGHA